MAEKEPLMPSIMPKNSMFTGFLVVFALFGAIVKAEMRYYQSHLLMVRPKDGDDDKDAIDTGCQPSRHPPKRNARKLR